MSNPTMSVNVKGLATLALLKTNYDSGHDHIEMFVPFALDAILTLPKNEFSHDEIKAQISKQHQLSIPSSTLSTILQRLTRRNVMRREHGYYFRTEPAIISPNIESEKKRVSQEQAVLAQALIKFGKSSNVHFESVEDALAAILEFLEEYHISLALSDSIDLSEYEQDDNVQLSRKQQIVIANFLKGIAYGDSPLSQTLQQMLEGYVLQNAMFLRDISSTSRRFNNLEVFVDTPVILGLLGYRGEAIQLAIREAFDLMGESGAILSIFDKTIREVRRVFSLYEHRLATSEGRKSLRSTDLARYFLTKGFSPSDVRQESALLERNLADQGIRIISTPEHRAATTLDEQKLARRLANSEEEAEGIENRVTHDVDCIAAILTIRRGDGFQNLENSKAVFLTNSNFIVRQVTEWYREQGMTGVSPIIHQLALSNLAWLKKPASATKLKMHELVALCYAALRPKREMWERFLAHLKNLEKAQQLSSDEAVAVVASEFTDKLLLEAECDIGEDAASIGEVIERVKTTYKQHYDDEVGKVKEQSTLEINRVKRQAEEEIHRAKLIAHTNESENTKIKSSIEAKAHKIGFWVSSFFIWAITLSLIIVTILTIPGVRNIEKPSFLDWLFPGVLACFSLLGTITGFNLLGLRLHIQNRVSGWVKTLIL